MNDSNKYKRIEYYLYIYNVINNIIAEIEDIVDNADSILNTWLKSINNTENC